MALVCHCNVVRERAIVHAVQRGAHTMSEVIAACQVANQCGGCEHAVADVIERTLAHEAARVGVRRLRRALV